MVIVMPRDDDRGARMLADPVQYVKDELERNRREVAEEMRQKEEERRAKLTWWQRVFDGF